MAVKSAKDGLLEKLVPILLLASIILAFVVGILWQKVSQLEGGGAKVSGTTTGTDTGSVPTNPGLAQGKLTEDQVKKIPQISNEDHVRGNKNAKVFLIEYSDFECPFCQRFHPTTQQVLKEYKDDVALVFRHFPLDQIHPKARPAANASECITELGGEEAFWKFADEVFTNQQTALSDLQATAAKVGVDAGKFKTCFDSNKYEDKVNDQYQKGLAAGITGTPGNFIVNDKGEAWLVPGAYPFDTLKVTIDEALK